MVTRQDIHTVSDQNEDGSFSHYVTIFAGAPWMAPSENSVQLATESDAHKLKALLISKLEN